LSENCKRFIEHVEILTARERVLYNDKAEADRVRVSLLANFYIEKAARFFDKLPEEKLRNFQEFKEALINRFPESDRYDDTEHAVEKMLELRQGKYESIKEHLVHSQKIYDDIDPVLEKFFIKKFIKGLQDEQIKVNLLVTTSSEMNFRIVKQILKEISRIRANNSDSENSNSNEETLDKKRKKKINILTILIDTEQQKQLTLVMK
jgi:hypothetical protein